MACSTCAALAGIGNRRKSSNMKGKSFQKKAIGGGLALVAEYLLMDRVVTTRNLAYGQIGVGALGYFMSKNPIIKTAALGVGVLGAAKAFTGRNVVTQTAISGINPYYRISGTNPLYSPAASGGADGNFL